MGEKARQATKPLTCASRGAPEGIRTPNLLIRSQMLYPLSYGRWYGLECIGRPAPLPSQFLIASRTPPTLQRGHHRWRTE